MLKKTYTAGEYSKIIPGELLKDNVNGELWYARYHENNGAILQNVIYGSVFFRDSDKRKYSFEKIGDINRGDSGSEWLRVDDNIYIAHCFKLKCRDCGSQFSATLPLNLPKYCPCCGKPMNNCDD